MSDPKAKLVKEYVTEADGICPWCGEESVEGIGDFESDVRICWRDMRCTMCLEEWKDEYRLEAISWRVGGDGVRVYSDEWLKAKEA